MDKILVVKKNNTLNKPVGAIYLDAEKISFVGRKIFNSLLKNAFLNLTEQDSYEISEKTLRFQTGIADASLTFLKKVLKNLNTTGVEWNVLGRDQSVEWKHSTLIADVSIKKGMVTYSFSKSMRENLVDSKIYAQIDLLLQKKFTNKYALALYELAVDAYRECDNVGETRWMTLEDYKTIMGVPKPAKKGEGYDVFTKLKKFIITKSVEEVNAETDFNIRESFKKTGRSFTYIKFKIKKSKKNLQGHAYPIGMTPCVGTINPDAFGLIAPKNPKSIPSDILSLIDLDQQKNCHQILCEIIRDNGNKAAVYYIEKIKAGEYTFGKPADHWGRVLRGSKNFPGPVARKEYEAYLEEIEIQEKRNLLEIQKQKVDLKEEAKQKRIEDHGKILRQTLNNMSAEQLKLLDQFILNENPGMGDFQKKRILSGCTMSRVTHYSDFMKARGLCSAKII